jgi:hypothetical protein
MKYLFTTRFPAVRRNAVLVLAAVSLIVSTATAAQSQRIVSGNPHEPSLRSGATPPLAGIASLSTSSANAYHASSQTEVNRALAYNAYGKARIVSDDAGGVSPANAMAWMDQVCAAGHHYEHFDAALGSAGYGYRATNGQVIDALSDFPSQSKNVLNHIKASTCVSDLAPFGTLSVVNGQFRWNNQPVRLMGHSWMGALAGKNFSIDGYLNVLEQHRVNLTRVWVVEQWTGLLINKPGAPHPSNAVLPFSGSIDFAGNNDTVNLFVVNPAFLSRLHEFVNKAWARGIVVQLTLFDRHGLLNKAGEYGRWLGSPYNKNNNAHELMSPGASGKAPAHFLAASCATAPAPDCQICDSQLALVNTIVSELDAYGNVIFEIMNEPLATEWGESQIVAWHSRIAGLVKNAP